MEYSTLIARLKTASESFENLEVQLADPDIANDPKKLESIARERSKLEPLVIDFNKLLDTDKEIQDSRNLLKDNRNDKEMESLINEEITNSLNPPISDSEALTGFTLHPIFCPYLSYILARSPAHIQASLPPAPALISNITLLSSLGSLGNKAIVVF